MIDEQKVETVRQLLAAEVSQREISRITGVSRDTIRLIFKGRWQMNAPRRQQSPVSRGFGRCPECGARVRLPCLACRVRRHRHCIGHVA